MEGYADMRHTFGGMKAFWGRLVAVVAFITLTRGNCLNFFSIWMKQAKRLIKMKKITSRMVWGERVLRVAKAMGDVSLRTIRGREIQFLLCNYLCFIGYKILIKIDALLMEFRE